MIIGVKSILGKRKTLLYSSWNYGGNQRLQRAAAKSVFDFSGRVVNAPPCCSFGIVISYLCLILE